MTKLPLPQEGGSHVRQPDGSLQKVASTIGYGEPGHPAGPVAPADPAPAPAPRSRKSATSGGQVQEA